MKNILIKSAVLAATVLFCATGIQANAASGGNTICSYNKIGGAPWTPAVKTVYYSGHIQCPATAHQIDAGYSLSYQRHY